MKSGNGRRFGGTPKLTRETRVLPKGTAVADRTLQRRARSDAPYLWLVAGVEGFAGVAEAGGEGLRADDGGVRAPAQDPALGFLDAVQAEAQPKLAARELSDFLAGVPFPAPDQVSTP